MPAREMSKSEERAVSGILAVFDFFFCLFLVSPLVRYIKVDRESALRKGPPLLTSPSFLSTGAIAKASLRGMAQYLGATLLVEKEMATCSSVLAWKIPWTEGPGGLSSMRSQRAGHD